MLRSRGFATEEIAGGYFCCKFNSLAGEVAVVNLVRNDFPPEMGQELDEPIKVGHIILNLRVEADPERLEAIVREEIERSRHPDVAFPSSTSNVSAPVVPSRLTATLDG